MITMTNAKALLVGSALASVLLSAACDRNRDETPPVAAIPEPTPPPAPSAEPAPVPSAAPAVVVPPRVGVALGAPDGVIADAWAADDHCNLESIDRQAAGSKPLTLKKGVHTTVSGWALGPKAAVVPDTIHVRFNSPTAGDFYGTASKRYVREDVNARHAAVSKDSLSGFELEFDSDQLPPGTYAVTTVMKVGDSTYICDNGRKLTRAP